MVDVGSKPMSDRRAVASVQVCMAPATLTRIRDGQLDKGDVLQVARLAGVMAAKQTATLIPLCHPLPLDAVTVDFEFLDDSRLGIVTEARVTARTGVEMEALTAASVAALTVYDMCKSVDRAMEITALRLEKKSGGKSGEFVRDG